MDFSKKTVNYCIIRGTVDNIVEEGVVENNMSGCRRLLAVVRRLGDHRQALFCGEDTGSYSMLAAEFLTSKGCFVWLGNARFMSVHMDFSREKTDECDARRIAVYAFRHADMAVRYVPLTGTTKRLRTLVKKHDALTDARRRLKCQKAELELVLKGSAKELDETIGFLTEQIKQVDKEITRLLKEDTELSENVALAVSVPGISHLTVAAIIVNTRNFTRFTDGRKYASHTGCVPYRHESGTSIKRRPRVSKASNRKINSLLTQGAVSIMTRNKEMMAYADRMRKAGKNTGFIINNIRNKIIRRLFAVIRDRMPYTEDYRNRHDIIPSLIGAWPG